MTPKTLKYLGWATVAAGLAALALWYHPHPALYLLPLAAGTMMSSDTILAYMRAIGVADNRGFFHSYMQVREIQFVENGAGTYTGIVNVPAGATLLDVMINGVALWSAATSALMNVGDVATPAGYFTAVDLKATDLLVGESISFGFAGGKQGTYIANSQVSPRYSAAARQIKGVITSVGAGTAGRTRMSVYFSTPTAVDIPTVTI